MKPNNNQQNKNTHQVLIIKTYEFHKTGGTGFVDNSQQHKTFGVVNRAIGFQKDKTVDTHRPQRKFRKFHRTVFGTPLFYSYEMCKPTILNCLHTEL